ncbi:MAG: hypothetical protein ACT4P7_07845 [Gemmatimonadaceae bacterium]
MPASAFTVPTPEERGESLRVQEVELRRERRWIFVRAILFCLLCSAAGLTCIAWAVHTTDQQLGLILFWGGLLIGNAGILVSVARALSRAATEGWL